jgi:hypothetical protein
MYVIYNFYLKMKFKIRKATTLLGSASLAAARA